MSVLFFHTMKYSIEAPRHPSSDRFVLSKVRMLYQFVRNHQLFPIWEVHFTNSEHDEFCRVTLRPSCMLHGLKRDCWPGSRCWRFARSTVSWRVIQRRALTSSTSQLALSVKDYAAPSAWPTRENISIRRGKIQHYDLSRYADRFGHWRCVFVRSYRVYCVVGDGESSEGSIWEALFFASHYKLDNLVAIFDINRLGQSEAAPLQHDMDVYKKRLEGFG